MRTFQFRLYPSKEQQEKLWKHANKMNSLYNYFLNQRIEAYKNKIKIGCKEQSAELVQLKIKDPELKEIFSQVLQIIPKRLNQSYENFFRRIRRKETPGFPKFRSCRNFFGICYPQHGYKIKKNKFITKVYGEIEFSKHREILGKIRTVSISNKNDKFYLNITTDHTEIKQSSGEIAIDNCMMLNVVK